MSAAFVCACGKPFSSRNALQKHARNKGHDGAGGEVHHPTVFAQSIPIPNPIPNPNPIANPIPNPALVELTRRLTEID